MNNDVLTPHEERLNVLRVANSERCANYLREIGLATVAEVAEGTGLSKPTVKDRLDDLRSRGIVTQTPNVVRSGQHSGRPAAQFEFNHQRGYVIGVELGKHSERIMFCNSAGRIVGKFEFDAIETMSAAGRLSALEARLASCALACSEPLGEFQGLGVAVPGSLTPNGEMRRSAVFSEWTGVNIKAAFEKHFTVPLFLENDINAACVAEHRLGSARGNKNVVLALLWHQVAAGILINGELYRGANHVAGELNLLVSTQNSEESDRLWPSLPSFLETVAAAETGDALAMASVERFSEKASDQLAAICATLDPELILLHGPVAQNSVLVQRVAELMSLRLLPATDVPVAAEGLGLDGPVLGVILAALDAANTRLFGDSAQLTQAIVR